ncbi:MAG: helix-turn-helix transcriptional regulator, partial [Clostridia bacterium]|nr:helix-turn-helix transcriptional regulator [Clostridia bacterium]
MTDKKSFGAFIKSKRTERGYSQKELAEMLFVTEGAVSKWERGVSYPDITLISD